MYPVSRCFRLTNGCWLRWRNDEARPIEALKAGKVADVLAAARSSCGSIHVTVRSPRADPRCADEPHLGFPLRLAARPATRPSRQSNGQKWVRFAAAIIAYYVSLRIGFAQPVWALTTVFLVSQPLAGQVFSKALFRMLGTVLGGSAAVILVPAFVNEPLVLSFVLALWLGLCLYLALLDRTPRSYVFLLAGYTAGIISFPSVLTTMAFVPILNWSLLRILWRESNRKGLMQPES
jgi:Fusaric acid resistance protein family